MPAGGTVEGRLGQIDVLDADAKVADVVGVLAQGGVDIVNVQTISQTLEDYYVALLKEDKKCQKC